jgi:hypothetical protein
MSCPGQFVENAVEGFRILRPEVGRSAHAGDEHGDAALPEFAQDSG